MSFSLFFNILFKQFINIDNYLFFNIFTSLFEIALFEPSEDNTTVLFFQQYLLKIDFYIGPVNICYMFIVAKSVTERVLCNAQLIVLFITTAILFKLAVNDNNNVYIYFTPRAFFACFQCEFCFCYEVCR